MVTPAEIHDAYAAASIAQRARLVRDREQDRWGGPLAEGFRIDPHRAPDPVTQALLDIIQPGDVVLDVGGGAGRFSLPLALHCREAINVDPSSGMRQQFEASATEAGIANARYVEKDWQDTSGLTGDVTIAFNVTYFVPNIAGFLKKLHESTRRQVVIGVLSIAPIIKPLYPLLYGEDLATWPNYRQLLPVLWEMGIIPDIKVMDGPRRPAPVAMPSPEEFVARMPLPVWMLPQDLDRARKLALEHFDQLFVKVDAEGTFVPRDRLGDKQLLISWQGGAAPRGSLA